MSTRISNWSRASLALLLCLVVVLLATPRVVLGQGNGNGNNGGGTNSPGQLVITAATVDVSSTVITITGQNLGNTAPAAFLGLPDGTIVDLLFETLVTPNTFDADLPASILPGNYLLIVRSGNGSNRIDSMDITIGIQGEQGIQGDQGDQGIQGIQGDQGDQGDQGIQGIQGIQGVTGPTGAAGTNGTNGINGAPGAQGDPGVSNYVVKTCLDPGTDLLNERRDLSCACDGGRKPLGGGFDVSSGSLPAPLPDGSTPDAGEFVFASTNSPSATGWRVISRMTGAGIGQPWQLVIRVVCGDVL